MAFFYTYTRYFLQEILTFKNQIIVIKLLILQKFIIENIVVMTVDISL